MEVLLIAIAAATGLFLKYHFNAALRGKTADLKDNDLWIIKDDV